MKQTKSELLQELASLFDEDPLTEKTTYKINGFTRTTESFNEFYYSLGIISKPALRELILKIKKIKN